MPGERRFIASMNADLRGFPLRAIDLDPFYDEITQHIGISGTEDDPQTSKRQKYELVPKITGCNGRIGLFGISCCTKIPGARL